MISMRHENAKVHFDRDCKGVADFFRGRLGYHGSEMPSFEDVGEREMDLDKTVQASGFFSEEDEKNYLRLMREQGGGGVGGGEGGEGGEGGGDGEGCEGGGDGE